jgi:hypothetical protein
MNGWLMHDAEAVPVVLRVKQLYLWEDLRRELEDGEGYIRLHLLFDAPTPHVWRTPSFVACSTIRSVGRIKISVK